MAIAALPPSTARLLTSTQVLTDPASIVKELLDNSLDAKATFIEVLISLNTIDRIEVRDNGHGIAQLDLDALGRRGHTSKIRTFEELKNVAGVSLGFRGEALGSAAILGEVSILTRTESDDVATQVKLRYGGGIETRSSMSHPVGTTVCVRNLFSHIPVRKQQATKEKSCIQQLNKIRDLLQLYAIIRRNVRFRFKVLKSAKYDWSFSPRPKDKTREVVSQILSRELSAQCIEISRELYMDEGAISHSGKVIGQEPSPGSMPPFTLEAFLPRANADGSKISGGQYLSIDSRPVTCARGMLKKVVASYVAILKGTQAEPEKIKNPFLCLNIICPPGSYDANVEPAKNDIIFVDEPGILLSIEAFFISIYGNAKANLRIIKPLKHGNTSPDSNPLAVEPSTILFDTRGHSETKSDATKRNSQPSSTEDSERHREVDGPQARDISITVTKPDFIHIPDLPERHLLNSDEEPSSDFTPATKSTHRLRNRDEPGHLEHEKDVDGIRNIITRSNPWTIAKPKAFVAATNNNGRRRDLERAISRADVENGHDSRPIVLSDRPSRPPPAGQTLMEDYLQVTEVGNDTVMRGSLTNWAQTVLPQSFANANHLDDTDPVVHDEEMLFGSLYLQIDESTEDYPRSPPATQCRRIIKTKRGLNKPFVLPVRRQKPTIVQDHVAANTSCQLTSLEDSSPARYRDSSEFDSPNSHRNERTSAALWPQVADEVTPAANSMQATSSVQDSPSVDNSFLKTTLPDDDPRSMLMRNQKSTSKSSIVRSKLQRSQTNLLPFETIAVGTGLHNLEQTIKIDASSDSILFTGAVSDSRLGAWVMGLDEISTIQERIENVVEKWREGITELTIEAIEYDFGAMLARRKINVSIE